MAAEELAVEAAQRQAEPDEPGEPQAATQPEPMAEPPAADDEEARLMAELERVRAERRRREEEGL
ncbi:MAG: hypothetical protein M3O87_01010 [Candidatus Dormibacteraeota bacterium]|nr:hypothetical protein [Candidatus Dormibacteraeota bacterium]